MKRNRLGDKKRNLPNTGVELSNPAVNGVLSILYFVLKELGHSIFNYRGHVIEFLQIEGNLKIIVDLDESLKKTSDVWTYEACTTG